MCRFVAASPAKGSPRRFGGRDVQIRGRESRRRAAPAGSTVGMYVSNRGPGMSALRAAATTQVGAVADRGMTGPARLEWRPWGWAVADRRHADCHATDVMASYSVNERGVRNAERLIDARQYVLDSDWGEVQPRAAAENRFLDSHSWDDYAAWHLGLTDGVPDQTKGRYAFGFGDFRRVHRSGIIACQYRAAEWRHKAVELAAHELLQRLDRVAGIG